MFQKLKDLFIPHTENGFKPNFLERVSVGIMLVLILLSFAVANIQALLWIGSDWMVSTILPAVIVDLTNEERITEKKAMLTRSTLLDRAAQLKANDMAKNQYFAHYSPTGISPWYWFDQVSYNYVQAGENLAVHFTDSSEVISAWMKSPGHRANILNGDYIEIGIGTAKGEYKGFPTVFVVQLFGTPPAVLAQTTPTQVVGVTAPSAEADISVEAIPSVPPTAETSTQVAPATFQTVSPQETVFRENIDTPQIEETVVIAENIEPTPVEVEETIVLYSDLATSTRPGIPAIAIPVPDDTLTVSGPQSNLLQRSATQPSQWLQIIYGVLALLVFVGLTLSIVIEWRRQHPIQIAYAGGLLVVMAMLFYIHIALTSGAMII